MFNRSYLVSTALNQPAIVRFYSPMAGGSFILRGDDVLFNVPADFNSTLTPAKDLVDRLRELRARYSQPWIPNSIAPKASAFEDARAFVLTLPLMQIDRPSIHVAADGEVNFEWKGPDFHIDLGFYGDDLFSYYATKQGCQPLLGDDIPVKDGIPKELIEFASAV